MDNYAVIGNPIAQSKSPLIHGQFAEQTGQLISYGRVLTEPQYFDKVVTRFMQKNGQGLSVTMPFKQQAYAIVDHLTDRAIQAGAVNTITQEQDGKLAGDNTDGVGLLVDLSANLGWMILGKSVLVIGAGGAARGILANLLDESPANLVVANRTAEKAHRLVEQFANLGSLQACGLDEPGTDFDIVINATGAGLSGTSLSVNTAVIGHRSRCYDLSYSSGQTPFLQWAQSLGATELSDGLGMLVEQASCQFFKWRGQKPNTSAVIAQLRKEK